MRCAPISRKSRPIPCTSHFTDFVSAGSRLWMSPWHDVKMCTFPRIIIHCLSFICLQHNVISSAGARRTPLSQILVPQHATGRSVPSNNPGDLVARRFSPDVFDNQIFLLPPPSNNYNFKLRSWTLVGPVEANFHVKPECSTLVDSDQALLDYAILDFSTDLKLPSPIYRQIIFLMLCFAGLAASN